MKAKIAPKPEIVLLYQQEKIKNGDKLPEILEQMGIRWKAVTQQELCFTTGELAEYRRKEDGERQELQQIPQTPAMAMGGIAGKRLDQLLMRSIVSRSISQLRWLLHRIMKAGCLES